ncbi:MAG: L,D-transpeptidase family protein [Acidobacteria bacterium]|nr:L,D-transpeptidase family protein [Acidobacteriota bacterium]
MAPTYTSTRVDTSHVGESSAETGAAYLDIRSLLHALVVIALIPLLSLPLACRRKAAPPAPVAAPQPPAPETARSQLGSRLEARHVASLAHPFIGDVAEEAEAVYAAREWKLLWTVGGRATPQARAVEAYVASSGDRGLVPADYDAVTWVGRFDAAPLGSLDDRAELDLAFTASVMRIVHDLHHGRVNPNDVDFEIEAGSGPLDIATFVASLAIADDAAQRLSFIEPRYPGYERLIAALKQYRAMSDDAEGIVVSEMRVVEPGSEYADVPKLVLLLRELGDLPPGEAPEDNATLYTGGIVEAVRRFQARHGIESDGRIGPATFRAINTPLSWRVRQIELTLERWRWVPRRFERPPVIVNIPEYSLRAFDAEGRPAVDMRVVVGRALRSPTPVLSGTIERVIFQPYWNVPYSILKNEVLDGLDDTYLAENDMEIVDLGGKQRALGDEALAGLRGGTLRLRQRPGARNSLGPVKFDFANEHSIYLHGTPSQALFARSRRDFSHGCIRVEDPETLAVWLLRDEPEWTREKIRRALAGGATRWVKLEHPTPVLLLYGTAMVREDGIVRFFDDIYGIDRVLDQALRKPRWQSPSKKPDALMAANR